MTPAARVQAAIDILSGLERSPLPADRFIRDWFRRRRYAGSKDRAAVASCVFDVLRHRAFLSWRMRSESPRALVIGTLLRDGGDLESVAAVFYGEGYGPTPLTDEETAVVQLPPVGNPPPWVQGGYPEWLQPELTRAFGPNLLDETVALQSRAPIDLRVNTLKAARNDVLSALRGEGYETNFTQYSPFGIRLEPGVTGLDKTALFQSGAFEFQDEASQIASLLVDAKPGMRVFDLAAGGGGKSLAIAAAMQNEGEIVATDIDAGRLRQLAIRAERAGATIVDTPSPPLGGGAGETMFDRVLVDAPCSGTGTWRRQPELRWRLTPERLAQVRNTQKELLEDGAHHVKPGARLIYATCSLLPSENEDQIEDFLARHPNFAIVPTRAVWPEAIGTHPPHGLADFFKASPLSTNTDGFFTSVLARKE
ncbi:MAG TPA: RsmB/NOP family class I SAM-dependent RNA methyltransferase [Rhizomicrobium sp.]